MITRGEEVQDHLLFDGTVDAFESAHGKAAAEQIFLSPAYIFPEFCITSY
jgi:hypothetical protein